MNRVTFTRFTAAETGWDSYNSEIRPNAEPSTYGALLVVALTAFFVWRLPLA